MENCNIEIKARLGDEKRFGQCRAIAEELCGRNAILIEQHDVFFNVRNGRLKLRLITGATAELIQYDRPDQDGPKLSKFRKIDISEEETLRRMLTDSLGIKGTVHKQRYLSVYEMDGFMTRIHLDTVDKLGHFLEFEVCLTATQTEDDGKAVANKLMDTFRLTKQDLIETAYVDILVDSY